MSKLLVKKRKVSALVLFNFPDCLKELLFINMLNRTKVSMSCARFGGLENTIQYKQNIIKSIIKNKPPVVVSFDIFDTLLVRPAVFPTDIFYLLQEKIEKKFGLDFIKLRLNAESLMEQEGYKKGKIKNLDEIYDFISSKYGIDKEITNQLMQEEIQLEMSLLEVRPDVKELYDAAVEAGIRIIAVSDMYLSSQTLSKILHKKGLDQISEVYVSNAYNAVKSDGGLFEIVLKKEKIASSQLMHIGDNYHSDCVEAGKKQILAFHYPSVRSMIFENPSLKAYWEKIYYSQDAMARVLYGYVINRYLRLHFSSYNEKTLLTNLEALGSLALAPVLFYIAQRLLYNSKIQKKYDCIHFASRDGYLPKKIYDILAKGGEFIPADYLYCSRRSYFCGCYKNYEEYLKNSVMDDDYTLENYLLYVLQDRKLYEEKFCSEDLKLRLKNNYQKIKKLLDASGIDFKQHYEQDKKLASNYYQQQIESDNPIIFDIGYSGSISEGIGNLTSKRVDKIYLNQTKANIIKDKNNKTTTFVLMQSDKDIQRCYDLYMFFEEVFSPLEGSCIGFKKEEADYSPILEECGFSEKMKNDVTSLHQSIIKTVQDIQTYFADYIKYLKVQDYNSLLHPLVYTFSRSPYQEEHLLKNIIFDDKACRGIQKSLCEKVIQKISPKNPFSKTGFDNPNFYISHAPSYLTNLNKKIAVHVHIFNYYLIQEILEYLTPFPYQFDLIITVTEKSAVNTVSNIFIPSVIKNLHNLFVEVVPNRGRDVAPWIIGTRKYQAQYDYICHIHTKESKNVPYANDWRRYLFNNLISADAVKEIISIFETRPQIGVIFPPFYSQLKNVILSNNIDIIGEFDELNKINKFLKHIGIEQSYGYSDVLYSGGTMLWYRPEALKILFNEKIKLDDFEEEPIGIGGTLAHVIERLPNFIAHFCGFETAIYLYEKEEVSNNKEKETPINNYWLRKATHFYKLKIRYIKYRIWAALNIGTTRQKYKAKSKKIKGEIKYIKSLLH